MKTFRIYSVIELRKFYKLTFTFHILTGSHPPQSPRARQSILTFSILVSLFFGTSILSAQSAKPNVIFILSDDQGWGDAGVYGATDILTPNIDRIAKNGIRFTQFYANAPVCSPSRAAILTGKTPLNAGVPGNIASIAGQTNGMPASEVTMAEMFKSNGYQTAAIGKWHLGYTDALQPGGQGFDYQFGHLVGCIDNYSHFYYWRGPNRHDLYQNGKEIFRDGSYFPAMCYEEASQFMTANQQEPFFIYYAMNSPHYPYQGSDKWNKYYREKGIPYPRNLYGAFVSTFDEYVGKLLDKLEQLNLAQNTIVIFQSDHGHSTEERAHFGGGSAGPFRGAKGSLYEGGLRVPAIISWPGRIKSGEVRNQWAIASDWYPTLADLCGLSMPEHPIDGSSLINIITNAHAPEIHESWHWNFGKHWSVRKGKWKLLYDPLDTTLKRNPEPNAPEDQFFLVNLEEDPGEKINLAESYPEMVDELKQLYHLRKN